MGDNNIQDKLGYLWVITTFKIKWSTAFKINWGTYG